MTLRIARLPSFHTASALSRHTFIEIACLKAVSYALGNQRSLEDPPEASIAGPGLPACRGRSA